ncbi:MAG: isoamylase early set domain-containing protein [Bacteroidetes bacterium]|nr:isoamylase early set domain-containing protein [Bacteroidota bacterium]
MSITKKFLKSKPVVKVTFKVDKEAVSTAESVHVVGEFNEWNKEATPMKPMKNGSFSTTVELTKDQEYQFRYLIDGKSWKNDEEADKLVQSPFADAKNSVVVV